MKIVCDACSAKYSIADEKVRGKVFKIRCKKCSNIIVVRGNADAADGGVAAGDGGADEGAAAEPGNPEAVWHLVIDQQQVGPLTPDEVRTHLDRSEIDAESYIWREGFGDWERIADVEPFTAWFGGAAAGAGADLSGGGLFGGGGVSDDARTAQADPGDLFSARAAEPDPGSDLFSSASAGGGGLFGGASAGASAADAGPMASSELKGQRSENSVLFSLNNLAALASDSSPRMAPSSSSSSGGGGGGGGMAQHAGGEGSGLIDIRSMAQVYLGDNQRRESAPPGSMDDLPVFSQSSFESASPMLLPTAAGASNNKLIIMLASLIGLLIVVAAVLIIVVMKGSDEKRPDTVASTTGDEVPPVGAGGAAGAAADVPAASATPAAGGAAPAAGGEAAAAAGDEAADDDEGDKGEDEASKPADRKPERDRAPDRRTVDRKPARSEKPEPEPAPRPSPVPTDSGGCDEVTCLVEPDKACCKKGRKSSSSPGRASSGGSSGSGLPEKPSRSDISSGIGQVRGKVQACGSKTGGKGSVTAKIKISPSGSVASVSASGGSGGLDACVESAVRGARFSKSEKGVTVNYPFVFR